MQDWLVNGVAGAAIGVDDRGLAYGDGLFETIAWRRGAARFAELHWARLTTGCERLGLPLPPLDAIRDDIARLATGHVRGTLKVMLTRGPGLRGYAPPPSPRPTRIAGFVAETTPGGAATAARCRSCATIAASSPTLAGLKTLNRLDNVLARAETVKAGADEGLMWDAAGALVGGTMCNIFVLHGEALLTPRLDASGVRGIMRQVVIEEAAALGVAVQEARIGRNDLAGARAAFLTNALTGLRPVASIDGRLLDCDDGLVRAIAARLARRGVEEAEWPGGS